MDFPISSATRVLRRFDSFSAGFTLIEVMVAMIILSLGVIGVAGMQLKAYRSNQQSALTTVAVQLSQDLAEKMRANEQVSRRPDRLNPYLFDTADDISPPGRSCFGDAACSVDDIAAFDIYDWRMQVSGNGPGKGSIPLGLPGGRGVVCRDDAPWEDGKGYRWACNDGAGPDAPIVVKVGWMARPPDGNASAAYEDRPAVVMLVKP